VSRWDASGNDRGHPAALVEAFRMAEAAEGCSLVSTDVNRQEQSYSAIDSPAAGRMS
jgi:hypothetical protein